MFGVRATWLNTAGMEGCSEAVTDVGTVARFISMSNSIPWLTCNLNHDPCSHRISSKLKQLIKVCVANNMSIYSQNSPCSQVLHPRPQIDSFSSEHETKQSFNAANAMSNTVTPVGPSVLMATYGRVTARLEQATGKQLSNSDSLCDFAKVLKERCDTDKHRQQFLKRARDVEDEISKRAKEINRLTYLQARNESFYEYCGDKDRWIMEHGSIAGWAEYMAEIGYTRYHESIHNHWTYRIRGVQDLEELWSDLCMAETKAKDEECR
jgi:hypothetical protein